MEVDDATALELRDLHERDPASPGELGCGQSAFPGEGAAQGDGEATPEFGGVPVERDMRGVVVAVWADRLPKPWIILGVNGGAPGRSSVLA